MVKVSVIIPTYKDWDRLAYCLRSLSQQSFHPYLYEIIVVNNAPDDRVPPSLVYPINLKVIHEKNPGSYAARNSALKIAKGEIVGFTDSDCIPDKNWITNAVEFLEKNESVSRVTGPVKIFSKRSRPSAVELYDSVYAFPQKECVQNGWAVTANLFTYKKVFKDVGYFNSGTMSGGDLEWGKRAQQKGYKIAYCEDVFVKHPARDTYQSLFSKAKRVGKGKGIIEPEKGKMERLKEFLAVVRPKMGEIKRILYHEKEIHFLAKIYLLILRHMILMTSGFWKLNTTITHKNKLVVLKEPYPAK